MRRAVIHRIGMNILIGNPGCCITVNQNVASVAWKIYMQSDKMKVWLRNLLTVRDGERDLSSRPTAAIKAVPIILNKLEMLIRSREAPGILSICPSASKHPSRKRHKPW